MQERLFKFFDARKNISYFFNDFQEPKSPSSTKLTIDILKPNLNLWFYLS